VRPGVKKLLEGHDSPHIMLNCYVELPAAHAWPFSPQQFQGPAMASLKRFRRISLAAPDA
jgi:hypothetical protein